MHRFRLLTVFPLARKRCLLKKTRFLLFLSNLPSLEWLYVQVKKLEIPPLASKHLKNLSCLVIIMSFSISSSSGDDSAEEDESKLRHTRRGSSVDLEEHISHNLRQHASSDSPQHRNRQEPEPLYSDEGDELYTSDSDSKDGFFESDDEVGVTPFSDSELASVISRNGRGRNLPTELCGDCKSIVGWFFLDRQNWDRAFHGRQPRRILYLGRANDRDRCLLCSFLGKLKGRLRANGLVGGVFWGDDPFLWASEKHRLFFVATSELETDMEYNNCFTSDSRRRGSVGALSHRIETYAIPARLRHWMAYCDAHHHQSYNCHGPRVVSSIPDFRVIDCRASPPRLFWAKPGSSLKYITLSYVWGQDPCEGPDMQGRLPPIEQLPELIRGVIRVTLALGYRYLWIDRYCVPQDDSTIRHSLVKNMDKIYRDSELCIVAAAAKSPKDGLHGITRPREVRQETIDLGSVSLTQVMSNIKDEIDSSDWNSRGWTYQESILPRRRLIFTATQCCFQCGEDLFLETLQFPSPSGDKLMIIPKPFSDKAWGNLGPQAEFYVRAQEYSRRQLSRDSDGLHAITGILKRIPNFTHVCGVPVFDPAEAGVLRSGAFLYGLAWTLFPKHFLYPDDARPRRRVGVPIWTWCAWKYESTPHVPSWDPAWTNRSDFVATTRIYVEDVQGNVARWSDCTTDAVTETLSTLSDVKLLRVRGWVCAIAVPDRSLRRNMRIWHNSGSIIYQDCIIERLNTLARERGMRSVNGLFIFSGWVVVLNNCSSRSEERETGYVMLLKCAPDGQSVERLDMCRVKFEKVPELSEDKTFLPDHGWTLRSFRIS